MSAIKRYIVWQITSRLHKYALVYPFVEDSKLIVSRGMKGATGNIYAGLHEFAEMGFLLHLLRPGDLFGDIGANVGSYTILASAVSKSYAISVEPVSKTFTNLKQNVAINNTGELVTLVHCGVGPKNGSLCFATSYDTGNYVVAFQDYVVEGIEKSEVYTLDSIFSKSAPLLLKIDVEGFEMSVLEGAEKILSNSNLKAIIIELSGLTKRYGAKEEDIHFRLLSFGFETVAYDPIHRIMVPLSSFNHIGNTIYIRDKEWVLSRIKSARKFSILNQEV